MKSPSSGGPPRLSQLLVQISTRCQQMWFAFSRYGNLIAARSNRKLAIRNGDPYNGSRLQFAPHKIARRSIPLTGLAHLMWLSGIPFGNGWRCNPVDRLKIETDVWTAGWPLQLTIGLQHIMGGELFKRQIRIEATVLSPNFSIVLGTTCSALWVMARQHQRPAHQTSRARRATWTSASRAWTVCIPRVPRVFYWVQVRKSPMKSPSPMKWVWI